MPDTIAFQLSVGMNYMYHQPLKASLIKDAWRDFVRRLRWRIHFELEGDDEFYDPDYDVKVEKVDKRAPPTFSSYIELGIARGTQFVNKTIANVPDEDVRLLHNRLAPHVPTIREYLLRNNYVITATDKNLGLAVSERTWLIEKSLKLLNNTTDYKRLSKELAIATLEVKEHTMTRLANDAFVTLFETSGKMLNAYFLSNKRKSKNGNFKVPQFYVIPKIHKTPVGMRPIIPCHSAVMNPAAKYVSKVLKPVIAKAPTIIHGC